MRRAGDAREVSSVNPFAPLARPERQRGAYAALFVPADAANVSVVMYVPPPQGAIVSQLKTNAATVPRWMVLPPIALIAETASISLTPFWPPASQYGIQGRVAGGTFAGSPAAQGFALTGNPDTDPILVMPGNALLVWPPAINTAIELGMAISEFINPDEFERWASTAAPIGS